MRTKRIIGNQMDKRQTVNNNNNNTIQYNNSS